MNTGPGGGFKVGQYQAGGCTSTNASGPVGSFAKPGWECFNRVIETGVLHRVGLRNTLEPDPDNTGVGSFLGLLAFFLESRHEFSCFMGLETREDHA
jgi:hypothetical protein